MNDNEKNKIRKEATRIGSKIDKKEIITKKEIDVLCDWVLLEFEELDKKRNND